MSNAANATNGSRTSLGAALGRPGAARDVSRTTWPAAAALALVALGCGHGHGGGGGQVDVVQHLFETEPNDHAWSADFFGALWPGDRIVIHGGVDDFGPDVQDGFAFVSAAPGHVEFALRSLHGADLDLCVYDAVTDEIVLCFESPYDPERGGFEVYGGGGEFHLVVSSFAGASGYELEIGVSSAMTSTGAAAATQAAPERGARERVASYLREPRTVDLPAADADLAPLLYGLEITLEPDGRVHRRAFRLEADGRVTVAR